MSTTVPTRPGRRPAVAAISRSASRRCLLAAPLLALVLSACSSMAPTYERPAAPVPAAWPSGGVYPEASATAAARTVADLPWRDFVRDPALRTVIGQALDGSRPLRKTLADIASARAQYRVQRAAEAPTLTAGGSGSRARTLASTSGGDRSTATSGSYAASLGVSSYELDLFGRVRSLSDEALETALATGEAARATQVSLVAETASAWLALAADRSQLAIAEATLDSAQRAMDLTRQRLDAGVASRVDVRQAETVYQQARADAASARTAIAQDRNALELLAGGAIDEALLPAGLPADDAAWFAEVPVGLSSDVLLQRPDVLQAEHRLKAADANIGAARAARFPTVSLTASGGLASAALSSLFSGGATVWSLVPAIGVPIFDGGAGAAGVAQSQAQRDGLLASYELAIQTAFREVADALARRGTMQDQLAAQSALVAATADSATLATERYRQGVDSFLASLDAQRTLYAAQQAQVTARQTALDNRVTLYRVLGGGADGYGAALAAGAGEATGWR